MVAAMRATRAGGRVGSRHRREQLDTLGDGGQPGHQGEGLQIVIPELGLSAEAPQLHHGEEEVEAIGFGLLGNGTIELERRHVLRGVRRHDPAIVRDRNEDPQIHRPSFVL